MYRYEKPVERPRCSSYRSNYWVFHSRKVRRRVAVFSNLEYENILTLEMKPCGVKVFDGWKDVIIPEYFITQSKTEDGFEIFRLDPIFPGYHWNF